MDCVTKYLIDEYDVVGQQYAIGTAQVQFDPRYIMSVLFRS